jgi:hypothetical protein
MTGRGVGKTYYLHSWAMGIVKLGKRGSSVNRFMKKKKKRCIQP